MSDEKGYKWWEFVESHVENLIPGFVVFGLLKWTCDAIGLEIQGSPGVDDVLDQNGLVHVAVCASLAYLFGVLCFISGRFLLHRDSRVKSREQIFQDLHGQESLARLRVDDYYIPMLKLALSCGIPEIRQEIQKRRQRARLLRAAVAPSYLVFIYMLVSAASLFPFCSGPLRTVFVSAVFLMFILVLHWLLHRIGLLDVGFVRLLHAAYVYGEFCIYEEACLGVLGKHAKTVTREDIETIRNRTESSTQTTGLRNEA